MASVLLCVAAAVFAVISPPICTAFLVRSAPRVQITNVVRRPSKLSQQQHFRHERMPRPRTPRWQKSRSFGSAREHRSAASEGSTDDG
ncbi:unnamed protein product, partial [Ascophyllum nodosum]